MEILREHAQTIIGDTLKQVLPHAAVQNPGKATCLTVRKFFCNGIRRGGDVEPLKFSAIGSTGKR